MSSSTVGEREQVTGWKQTLDKDLSLAENKLLPTFSGFCINEEKVICYQLQIGK